MKKLIPYPLYEVPTIEFWLNKHSHSGYKLIDFSPPFCTFIKNSETAIYYRLGHYSEEQKYKPLFRYGNLSIYSTENCFELPLTNHYDIAKIIAAQYDRIWEILLDIILCLFAGWQCFEATTINNSNLFTWSSLCLTCWIIHLVSTIAIQFRAKKVLERTHLIDISPTVRLSIHSYFSLKVAVILSFICNIINF